MVSRYLYFFYTHFSVRPDYLPLENKSRIMQLAQ